MKCCVAFGEAHNARVAPHLRSVRFYTVMKLRSAGWASALIALLSCMPALATSITFEPPSYIIDTNVNGGVYSNLGNQGGWSTSTYSGSVSALLVNYTAASAHLPIPISAPQGGGFQFAAAAGTPGGDQTLSQYNVDFTQAAIWSVSYDILVENLGGSTSGVGSEIGSFGLLGPAGGSFNAFDVWDSAASGSTFTAKYGVHLGNGGVTYGAPGDAWKNLIQGDWYRETTVFDVATDSILSVSITNLTAGTATSTATPTGWSLWPVGGGAPTLLMLYGQGPSNMLAFDNIDVNVAPEPSTLLLAALGFAAAAICRRRA